RPAYRMAGEIPGIGVSKETGSFIVRQMGRGPVRVRMTTTDEVNPAERSWNVVGEIPGGELRDRLIVVGAHFDGHDIAQGAMDDGAGAVTIMEAARALAKHKGTLKRTIRFICFACEEIGVTGSTCYVDKHRDELDSIDLMINCDGAGRGLRHGFRVSGPQELIGYLQSLADEIGYRMRVEPSLSAASDHWPFYMQGIPAATFAATRDPAEVARVGRGWGHTSADTLDKVDPRGLKEGAATLAQFLIRLADEPGAIAERTPIEEIVAYLEEKGLAKTLRIQKKWHPDSIR
ncbi:MAG: M28 family metallopeptidase, partial [Candidatus Bathyarchaeia archaeon]